MASKTITVCDQCGTPETAAKVLPLPTKRGEVIGLSDLCYACACNALRETFGIVEPSAIVACQSFNPDNPPESMSPLEARLDELRDIHGPVFVIETVQACSPGTQIQHGKEGSKKTVEIIEAVGDGRWFGKLVE